MPRKTPLSQKEQDICTRLRTFRKVHLELTQAAAARKLGIDSTRLGSYEHGRVPLRFALVDKFARIFDMNQIWLMEGKGRAVGYLGISKKLRNGLSEDALFSSVYERLKADWIESERFGWFTFSAILSKSPVQFHKADDPYLYLRGTLESIQETFASCPPRLRGDLLTRVLRLLGNFGLEFLDDFEAYSKTQENSEKRRLTQCLQNANNRSVTSPLALLIKRLNQATRQRGAKSRLAKTLGVPLANVSQWLSGEREPGGETTLRLLRWVELQERSTK